ncbi:hypothetical protein KC334_g55 [Hortaea werneckii]|nr:hypothetical protein KC334_g55 [Hortaea werneckii]
MDAKRLPLPRTHLALTLLKSGYSLCWLRHLRNVSQQRAMKQARLKGSQAILRPLMSSISIYCITTTNLHVKVSLHFATDSQRRMSKNLVPLKSPPCRNFPCLTFIWCTCSTVRLASLRICFNIAHNLHTTRSPLPRMQNYDQLSRKELDQEVRRRRLWTKRGKPATATYIRLLQEDDDKQAESSAEACANVSLVGVKPGIAAGYSSIGKEVAYEKDSDTLTLTFETAQKLAAWMEGDSKERVELLPKVQTVIIAMALGYDHACLLPDGGRGAVHSLPGTFTAELKNGEYSIRYKISRSDGCVCSEDMLKEDADDNNDELKVVYQSVRRAVIKRNSQKATTPKYATRFQLAVVALVEP